MLVKIVHVPWQKTIMHLCRAMPGSTVTCNLVARRFEVLLLLSVSLTPPKTFRPKQDLKVAANFFGMITPVEICPVCLVMHAFYRVVMIARTRCTLYALIIPR